MNKKPLEIYVHIPFCVKKCAYCDFLSAPADRQTRSAYADALIAEIKYRKTNREVNTIFMGGGTPSILDGSDTARIFRVISDNFSVSDRAEITMEVNPGTVTKEKAAIWKNCGVNRISIGLQSADNRELRMLGRIHTYEDFLATWEILRLAGFENINIDLISAIPGQTQESWEKTLRLAAALEPEHISAYSLIIEEGTPFYDRYGENQPCSLTKQEADLFPPLPDEDTEREIYKATQRILAEYGFGRYEISNYAKPGYECRHNLGYWERKDYLGLGLGAASLMDEVRFHNPSDMGEYVKLCETVAKKENFPRAHTGCQTGKTGAPAYAGRFCRDVEILTREDQMEEFMFLGLRKTEGISAKKFLKTFSVSFFDVYGPQAEKLLRQGLLETSGDKVRLTERGTDISNYVFSEFIF